MSEPAAGGGLWARKKAQTRRAIQEHAIRLFLMHGYDATTIEQVAAAANVSHMTVFRHFPKIYAADRDALRARTRLMLSTPALRARLWDNQSTTQQLLAGALTPGGHQQIDLATHVVASACLGAVTSALVTWAEADDGPELTTLIEQAFDALNSAFTDIPSDRFAATPQCNCE